MNLAAIAFQSTAFRNTIKMEQMDLPSKTDCNSDLDLCFKCAVCKFMTNSAKHLEQHTTAMHCGMPSKFFTRFISESDYTNRLTKQADSLPRLTHKDTRGEKFPTREKNDIPHHSDSTFKSEFNDDWTEINSNELKPNVKDLSNKLSKINDSLNAFSQSLPTLTYIDTQGGKFPTRERNDIPPHFDSTFKSEFNDDWTEINSNELKPNVKDLSNMLSKINDSLNAFSQSLPTLTHIDDIDTQGRKFLTRERDDIPLHSDSTFKSKFIDDEMEINSNEIKPNVKDLSYMLSKINDSLNAFSQSLPALTHIDTQGGKFQTRERNDIPLHSDSTFKSEFNDDGTEINSNELKPNVKDLSCILSKINDSLNAFSQSCVKTEMEYKARLFSDINQKTKKQETLLPSFSDCEIKEEVMHCLSCSYSNVDSDKLKSHLFTHHPMEAAAITNHFGEDDLKIHGVRFLCIKETCSFSTTSCNVYQQHLISCCSKNQTMTRTETGRLKSTIAFVLDFHNKLGLETISDFLDFVSSFRRIYTSNEDESKISDDLENSSSSSIVSIGNDFDSCLSCNGKKGNSKCSFSLVPGTTQNTDPGTKLGQTETLCVAKQNKHEERLMNSDPYRSTSPSSSKENIIHPESSLDQLVSNNMELENDMTGKQLYINNVSLLKEKGTDMRDEVYVGTKCNECGKIFARKCNPVIQTGTRVEEKESKCDECTKKDILFTHIRRFKGKRKFQCCEPGIDFSCNGRFTAHMRMHMGKMPFKCRECGKAFIKKISLILHMKSVHCGKKPFMCGVCGENFYVQTSLTGHMRSHKGRMPFECRECGKGFRKQNSLRGHLGSHKGRKAYECRECGKIFNNQSHLSQHMFSHSGERPFKCIQCGKGFRSKGILKVHKRLHTGVRPFMCNECGKGFNQKHSLTVHMRVHTREKPFKCDECGQRFSEKSQVKIHRTIHTGEKPFTCSDCGKSFSVKSALKGHMRLHTGEKPFKCNECNKSFREKSTLRGHMRLHTGEKPYKCDKCGKNFRNYSTLKVHMRLHTGQKSFKCNECDKCFSQKISLTTHMKLHTGEKQFMCDECGHGFSVKSSLVAHMRLHTGEKPFRCDKCGNNFRNRSTLTVHMRGHTGEKPFKCNECDRCFSQKSSLTTHMKRHI